MPRSHAFTARFGASEDALLIATRGRGARCESAAWSGMIYGFAPTERPAPAADLPQVESHPVSRRRVPGRCA